MIPKFLSVVRLRDPSLFGGEPLALLGVNDTMPSPWVLAEAETWGFFSPASALTSNCLKLPILQERV